MRAEVVLPIRHHRAWCLPLSLILFASAAMAAAPVELCTLTISDLSDANVRGATVQIDGKVAGKAPMTIQLPAGQHLVVLTQVGFAAFQRTVTLRAGHAQVLAPTMIATGKPPKGPTVHNAPEPVGSRPAPAAPAQSKQAKTATRAGPPPATPGSSAAPTRPATDPPTTGTASPDKSGPPSASAPAAAPAAVASAPPDVAGPTATDRPDPSARQMQLARGARVLRRGAVVWDLGVGYPHYLHAQGTVGVVRDARLAIDASLWVRSHIALTEGGLRLRMMLAEGGPFSAVAIGSIGGGGGLGGRDSFTASVGVGGVMVIAERFALGGRAMLNIWTERLCPDRGSEAEGDGADVCQGKGDVATARALHEKDLTERDTGAGLTLSATLEIALSARTQLFLVADMVPGQAERAGYSGVFNDGLIFALDPGYAGRAGISFIF